MELMHSAIAGTLESSDAQVMIEPAETLSISIKSVVEAQYGEQIRATVEEVLNQLEVKKGTFVIQDQGALDCTLRARVQTAVLRASDMSDNLPWGTKL
ncbi:citrate lyase acyl carrier protein [Atopobacter phocae]|uniref:citrate lyase acyl carrier protein n=1 Tax=Atopobacter phocae TaxID=136492 RepID=UPI0004721108|nr:citrate lyase acyl carrier protein [Atopobacter phocae]